MAIICGPEAPGGLRGDCQSLKSEAILRTLKGVPVVFNWEVKFVNEKVATRTQKD